MSIDEQIPDAELAELPGELCGTWAYIKWEQAGCPNRTEQESQREYQAAIDVRSTPVRAFRAFLHMQLSNATAPRLVRGAADLPLLRFCPCDPAAELSQRADPICPLILLRDILRVFCPSSHQH